MATSLENEKNFKILKLSQREAQRAGMGTSEGCICMHCNDIIAKRIYYIAVLNDCMCKKCFEHWYKNAENYPEDREVEARNYNFYVSKGNFEIEQKPL